MRRRRIVLGVVLVLAVGVAAAEVVLRLAAQVADDWIEARRDPRALVAAADLAVYGDSTAYGLGNERSFPAVLAETTGLRIVNRAKPGINSSQALVILRNDLARFRPRCFIVLVGVNDVWNLDDVDPELVPAAQRWQLGLQRLRVWRMARLWWYAGGAYERVKGQGFQRDRAAFYKDSDTAAITRHSIRAIHAAATETGGRVLFMGYQRRGWNAGADRAEAIIREEVPDDYLPIRHAFPDRSMFQRDGFHVTDEGAALIAELVRAELLRRGWIAEPPGRGGLCRE